MAVRLRIPVLLAAGLLLRPAPTQAKSPSSPVSTESLIRLDWNAPAECPKADAVRSEIIRLAGTTQGSHHLVARGSIRPAGSGWTLSLMTEFDGVTGERALSGASCDSLTDAAVLVLALIVNPGLAITAPQTPAVPQPTPASEPANPRAPLMQVGAYAGVQLGVIEDPSPIVVLSLGAAFEHLSLQLLFGLTPPQDVFMANSQPQVGGRLWLATVDALGCWAGNLGPAVLKPCLGFNVSRLHGRGLGVEQSREETLYWSAADLAVFAGLHLGRRIVLELGGVGQVPLHRPRVFLDDLGSVSRPAALALKILAGLAWTFD